MSPSTNQRLGSRLVKSEPPLLILTLGLHHLSTSTEWAETYREHYCPCWQILYQLRKAALIYSLQVDPSVCFVVHQHLPLRISGALVH